MALGGYLDLDSHENTYPLKEEGLLHPTRIHIRRIGHQRLFIHYRLS